MNHFFITEECVKNGYVYINGSDVSHIKNVLRMKAGEMILVSDGQGMDYTCEIESLEEQVVCRIVSAAASSSEPKVRFYLFQGLPKADKFEHIIQKSVELGVYEIIPVAMGRSVVKYDDKKAASKVERWQKIAESAAKQSKRGIIPRVNGVMNFKDALKYAKKVAGPVGPEEVGAERPEDVGAVAVAGRIENVSAAGAERPENVGAVGDERLGNVGSAAESSGMILIPYENATDMKKTKEILARIKPGMSVGIFVGPEGGIEDGEIALAQECGAMPITLGKRILRTETAPLMLLSVLTFALEE